ncbi:zona pellucida sperm-binding protein 4-like [Megalops cyprinoides]|uniref:zona pellucida sperm-binding protein 4-like n=1 Tax=Megalops cyprinoides TaxID=118141 RepID=UPI0018654886|nr:zona pellucida sperm-binding protein 4-like [Megalops cyprinoides]
MAQFELGREWLVSGLVALLAVAVAVAQKDGQSYVLSESQRCLVEAPDRIACGEPNIDDAECAAMDCCFDGQQCYYGMDVTVHCTRDGQFVVVVARDSTLPPLSLDSVSLLEGDNVPACAPVGITAAFAVFQFPVTACGTTVNEEGGYVVYGNKMVSSYEVGVGPFGSITRDSHYELFFQCRYLGSDVVSLVADVNTLAPPSPVDDEGPLRVELRLASGQCATKGCSDANAYESYYGEADYPVTKVLRQPVYVEVRILERTDPNIVLMLEHCWATSSPSPLSLPQWSLLVNGCPYQDDRYLTTLVPVDSSSGLPNPTHYKRFVVKMFTFVDAASLAPLMERVFIHCSTAVCYPSATDSCQQSCGRQRRAAPDARDSKDTVMVSSGELILTDSERSVSDMRVSEVPQLLNYALLGVAASVVLSVFALVLAVVWRTRPQLETMKL